MSILTVCGQGATEVVRLIWWKRGARGVHFDYVENGLDSTGDSAASIPARANNLKQRETIDPAVAARKKSREIAERLADKAMGRKYAEFDIVEIENDQEAPTDIADDLWRN